MGFRARAFQLRIQGSGGTVSGFSGLRADPGLGLGYLNWQSLA